jgi:GNAT superfamily N-acetyltransferase
LALPWSRVDEWGIDIVDDWSVERLNRAHQRDDFCCGKEPLDTFLQLLVSQYERRRLGRTFVAVRPGEKRVHGYYTLASGSVSFQDLPVAIAKRLPHHPLPVVLLARLAIDQTVQGAGLGELLLLDALRRCLNLSGELGVHAVEVRALDAGAERFYQRYGFVPLKDDNLHLYLPIRTIEDGLTAIP